MLSRPFLGALSGALAGALLATGVWAWSKRLRALESFRGEQEYLEKRRELRQELDRKLFNGGKCY